MQNPFTLTFGKSPLELVERPVQTNEIIEAFTVDPINQQMFIITGVRGLGKTVMMTDISHRLGKKEDWVVIELNPATDLLQGMLSELNSNQVCAGMIKSAKIDLSFLGFGVSIEGAAPITDTETAIIAIPFAFQVLGYLTWNHHGDYNAVRGEYEQYLSVFVYDKIWSELSQKDRMVARGIADVEGGKIKDIREHLHMETNEFNPYRKRLIKKGILSGETRGYVYFTLPLFEEYIMEND